MLRQVFICLGGNFWLKVKFITIEGLNAYSNYKIYRLGNFKIVIILLSKVSSVQFPERAQVVQSRPQHNHNFFLLAIVFKASKMKIQFSFLALSITNTVIFRAGTNHWLIKECACGGLIYQQLV